MCTYRHTYGVGASRITRRAILVPTATPATERIYMYTFYLSSARSLYLSLSFALSHESAYIDVPTL